jgi:MFS transporter, DHA2 family, methylenomycin A resistance protein
MREETRVSSGRQTHSTGALLAAVTLGFAVVQLDVSVVNVAVKSIGAALGGGVAGVQWVVDAYTLTFAAFILSAGGLGDRIGARRVLIGGFGLFTLASVACGAAPSIGFLVAARAVQGIGAAALGACSLALLNHSFPGPAARARAIAVWAAGGTGAMAAGPVVGGLLIAAAGWRWIFFINVPLGMTGAWLTARHGRETTRARDRGVDLPGQAAAVVALTALAGATIEAGSLGLGAPPVLAGYAIAVAAGAVFAAVETRRARPMLPMVLFRSREFTVTVVVGLLINVVFYGLLFSISLYVQRQEHLSPLVTGLAFVPVLAGVMAGNFAARLFRAARGAIVTGALLMTAGCAGLGAAGSGAIGPGVMMAGLTVTGLGTGLIVPAITSALLGSVDPSFSGIASGTLTAMRQVGSVLGVALLGSLLASQGAVNGLRTGCAIGVGLAVCVAGLSRCLPRPELARVLDRRAARGMEHAEHPKHLGAGVLQAVPGVRGQVDGDPPADRGLGAVAVDHAVAGQHVHHLVVGVVMRGRPARRDLADELRERQPGTQQHPELPVAGLFHRAVRQRYHSHRRGAVRGGIRVNARGQDLRQLLGQ